jgi:hypothetical protein
MSVKSQAKLVKEQQKQAEAARPTRAENKAFQEALAEVHGITLTKRDRKGNKL